MEFIRVLFRSTQYGLEISERRPDDAQPLVQPVIDLLFDGVLRDQIDDVDRLRLLSDATDTTNPLLHLHAIPGQVPVEEHTTQLEVEPLTADFGGPMDRTARRISEHAHDRLPVPRHTPMQFAHLESPRTQLLLEVDRK